MVESATPLAAAMVAVPMWREWPENSHVVLPLMIVSSLKSSPADIWLTGNHLNGKTADQVWDLCELCTPTRLHGTDMWFCSSNNDCYTLTQLISFWSFDPNLQSRWIFRRIKWDILDWQLPCWVMDIWLSSESPDQRKPKSPRQEAAHNNWFSNRLDSCWGLRRSFRKTFLN